MRNQILSGSPPLPVQNICQDIKVCLCWQQQVWWLPYQVERRHCQDAEMRETEDNQTEQKEHLSLNNTGYNNVLNATNFLQKR